MLSGGHLELEPVGDCADPSRHNCSPHADCIPLEPSGHVCTCNKGFIGDGSHCDGLCLGNDGFHLVLSLTSPVSSPIFFLFGSLILFPHFLQTWTSASIKAFVLLTQTARTLSAVSSASVFLVILAMVLSAQVRLTLFVNFMHSTVLSKFPFTLAVLFRFDFSPVSSRRCTQV